MVAKTLTCPKCNAPLVPPPGRTPFFCSFCGSTIVVPRESLQEADETPAEDQRPRPTPDLSKFTIDKQGDVLTISWKWRTWLVLFLIPFAIFWNGVAWTVGGAFFLLGIGAFGDGGKDAFGLFGALFAVPHLCIGIFLIYLIFALLFNRTEIRVDRDTLVVRHGPLPWKTPKPIRTTEIEQLYVKEKVNHSDTGSSTNYQLHVLLKEGKSVKLLGNDLNENTPRAVERMIEVHLGIKDRAVKGDHQ